MAITRYSGTYGFGATAAAPSGSFSGPGAVVLTGSYFYDDGIPSCPGFTLVPQANDGELPGGKTITFTLYKVALNLSLEPSSYTVALSGGSDPFTGSHYLEGVDTSAPLIGTSIVGSPTAVTATVPDVDNTVVGSCSLLACGAWNLNQWDAVRTPPPGFVLTQAASGEEFACYAYDSLPTGNVGGTFSGTIGRFAIVQTVWRAAVGGLSQSANSQFFAIASG